jgi:hypothetical protein
VAAAVAAVPTALVTKIELLTGFELRDDHSVAASRYACGVRDLAI